MTSSPRTAAIGELGTATGPQATYALQGDDSTTETDFSQEILHTIESGPDQSGVPSVPARVRHEIFHSRRCGQIQRWHTTFIDDSATVHNWMRKGTGLGSALLPNERWAENFLGAGHREHNPTMAGAIGPPGTDVVRSVASPVVYLRAQNDGRSGRFEGCTIPLDFDSWGAENILNDRGGDHENWILWWRMRHYQAVDVCFGHPRIHRVVHWFYFPRAWKSPADFLGWALHGVDLTDYFGTVYAAEFYDPVRRLSWDLDQGAGEWTTNNTQTWRVTGHIAAPNLALFPTIVRNDPYPFATKYAAAITPGRNGADDVCIGTYGTCYFGGENVGEGCRLHTRVVLLQGRNAPFTVSEDVNSGQQHAWLAAANGREDGWLGLQFFLITAQTRAECRTLIDLAHARRLADQPVPFSVPQSVIDGMDPTFDNRFGPRGRSGQQRI